MRVLPILFLLAATATVGAQEVKRRIIARADVAGTDKEMVLVETEIPPGATSPRHTHPGEEAFYVVQGAMIQFPGRPAEERAANAGGITPREVPHAGYTVVGPATLKQVSVYVVDKGKPLTSPAR